MTCRKYTGRKFRYFESLVEVVCEIKRRVDNSESLSRNKIIDYFRKNDIKVQFSPPIINDIIWNLRHLYPEDFRNKQERMADGFWLQESQYAFSLLFDSFFIPVNSFVYPFKAPF